MKYRGYTIVKSGWDNTWIIIPPSGLYEDKNGFKTQKEALASLKRDLNID